MQLSRVSGVLWLSSIATAVHGGHSPAFFWSGRPSTGPSGGNYLHEVSGAALQSAVAGLASGTAAQPFLPKPRKAPEVQVVFLFDELGTDDVRSLGTSAFPVLQKLMADSPSSLAVPFTTRQGALRFQGATNVPLDSAEQFLTAFPELAENGKTDIMLIQLPSSVQAGKHDGLAEHDALVGRVTRAIAKATSGNYAALLTGLVGNKNDVELVTMRRRLAAMEEEVGLHIDPMLMAALLVSFMLIIIFINGFCCLFSLQTPKKFDEVKNA